MGKRKPREIKIPTQEDFRNFDGGHGNRLWLETPDSWICPVCIRTKFETLRWTKRSPQRREAFHSWFSVLHRHHDHSAPLDRDDLARFPATLICDQCNWADAFAKGRLGLPENFSFSPDEIFRFVISRPHGSHEILLPVAQRLFDELIADNPDILKVEAKQPLADLAAIEIPEDARSLCDSMWKSLFAKFGPNADMSRIDWQVATRLLNKGYSVEVAKACLFTLTPVDRKKEPQRYLDRLFDNLRLKLGVINPPVQVPKQSPQLSLGF